MNNNFRIEIIKICMKCALDDFNKTNDEKYIDEYNSYKEMLDNTDIINIEINLNAEKLNRLRLCS